MSATRFDLDLWPRPLKKNRLAMISAADGPEQWSIGDRHGRRFLCKQHEGDRLTFGRERITDGRFRLFPKAEWVIRSIGTERERLAGLSWNQRKGGRLERAEGESVTLKWQGRTEPAISSSVFRISVINVKSRISIENHFLPDTEIILVAAFLILREELSD